jgi:hypothetical protein
MQISHTLILRLGDPPRHGSAVLIARQAHCRVPPAAGGAGPSPHPVTSWAFLETPAWHPRPQTATWRRSPGSLCWRWRCLASRPPKRAPGRRRGAQWRDAEGHEDRRGDRAGKCQGDSLCAGSPRHSDQVCLLRTRHSFLAASNRPGDRRARRDRQPRHNHAVRRHRLVTYNEHPLYTGIGDSAPRPGPRQQPQPQRRVVAPRQLGRLSCRAAAVPAHPGHDRASGRRHLRRRATADSWSACVLAYQTALLS